MHYKDQLLQLIADYSLTSAERDLFVSKNDSYFFKRNMMGILQDVEMQPIFEKLRNHGQYDSFKKFIEEMNEYKPKTDPTDPIYDDTISIVH